MCITEQSFTNDGYDEPGGPKVGEFYMVLYECWGFGKNNIPIRCYRLAEFAAGRVYDQRNFSPCPPVEQIEETNPELQTVTV